MEEELKATALDYHRFPTPGKAGPNHRLQATGNSLRSCVASAAPRA